MAEFTAVNKATVFTSAGPGSAADNKDGVLANPDLLWVEDDWTEERVLDAKESIRKQVESGVQPPNEFWINKYRNTAGKYWHEFYKRNKANFYKDRHYLHVVFPELAPVCGDDGEAAAAPRKCLLEGTQTPRICTACLLAPRHRMRDFFVPDHHLACLLYYVL